LPSLRALKLFSPPACASLASFYAQVEHERLGVPRDQPLAVLQWDSALAVNYPARRYGVKRGSRGADARKLCPNIVLACVETVGAQGASAPMDRATTKVDLERYRAASRRVFDVLERECANAVIEKAGLDEAYVDCTAACDDELEAHGGYIRELPAETVIAGADDEGGGADGFGRSDALLRAGCVVCARLRAALLSELRFTSSGGVAHNKMLAKQASALNKPNRQAMVPTAAAAGMLAAIKVKEVRGLGGKLGLSVCALLDSLAAAQAGGGEPAAAGAEAARSWRGWDSEWTAGDVVKVEARALAEWLGEASARFVLERCSGLDDERVLPSGPPASHMEMKSRAMHERAVAADWLRTLAAGLASRIQTDSEAFARAPRTLTITLGAVSKLRSRSGPFPPLSSAAGTLDERVGAAALALLDAAAPAWPIYRLSLQATNFHALERGSHAITSWLAPPARTPAAEQSEPAATGETPPSDQRCARPRAAAAPSAAEPADEPAEAEWACARCTLLCPTEAVECTACGAGRAADAKRPRTDGPRDHGVDSPASRGASRPVSRPGSPSRANGRLPKAVWSCVACTYECSGADTTCQMCGALRGSTLAATQQLRAMAGRTSARPASSGDGRGWQQR
jgi:DNA polymerase eta